MKPTNGRVIHWRCGDEWWTALVVDDSDEKAIEVHLFVPSRSGYRPSERQFVNVAQVDETWRWPPRVA